MLDITPEEFAEVYRAGSNEYSVWGECDAGHRLLYTGNREEVHSWLAVNGYKRQSGWVGQLTGAYRREGVGHAA